MGTAAPRPYPLTDNMVDRLGGWDLAAERFGVHSRTIRRWVETGLTEDDAERVAQELGEWPGALWPSYQAIVVDDHSDDDEPDDPGPDPQLALFPLPEAAHAPALHTRPRPPARRPCRRDPGGVLVLPI